MSVGGWWWLRGGVQLCYQPRGFRGVRRPRERGGAEIPQGMSCRDRPPAGALIGGRFPLAETTGTSGLADRYAAALFDLADERRVLDAVAGDLRELRAMLHESGDLARLLRSPVVSRDEQGKAVAALAERAGLSDLTRDFLGLVAKNRRLFAVPAMIEAYLGKLAERRGEINAEITVAQPLNEARQAALLEQLRRTVGARVVVDIRVDPRLLGGMIVKIGSRMVDASLNSRLQRLRLAMKATG
jgi:F-type H+-transporting ATPase subunit delta